MSESEAIALCRDVDAQLAQFSALGAASPLGLFLACGGVARAALRAHGAQATVVSDAADPRNGAALVRYADGSVYLGELRGGLRQGLGVRLHAGAAPLLYSGEYSAGKKHGRGRLLDLASGAVLYDGQWSADQRQGEGALFSDGGTYRGQFLRGAFHGQGKLSWLNGDVYCGEFRAGRRSGRGATRFAGGDAYEGEFRDGLFHGAGAYRWADGALYVGQFRDGRVEGEGALQCAQLRGVGVFGGGERPDSVRYALLQP